MTQYPDPLLPPDQIPQVALESMNRTHQEEVTLVNRLAALAAKGLAGESDEAAITDQLNAWIDHTRDHFARENQLMERYGFPAYPIHREEHDRVLKLLADLRQAWLDGGMLQPLARFLFEDWPAWFEQHVTTMDEVTAGYIRQQGG